MTKPRYISLMFVLLLELLLFSNLQRALAFNDRELNIDTIIRDRNPDIEVGLPDIGGGNLDFQGRNLNIQSESRFSPGDFSINGNNCLSTDDLVGKQDVEEDIRVGNDIDGVIEGEGSSSGTTVIWAGGKDGVFDFKVSTEPSSDTVVAQETSDTTDTTDTGDPADSSGKGDLTDTGDPSNPTTTAEPSRNPGRVDGINDSGPSPKQNKIFGEALKKARQRKADERERDRSFPIELVAEVLSEKNNRAFIHKQDLIHNAKIFSVY